MFVKFQNLLTVSSYTLKISSMLFITRGKKPGIVPIRLEQNQSPAMLSSVSDIWSLWSWAWQRSFSSSVSHCTYSLCHRLKLALHHSCYCPWWPSHHRIGISSRWVVLMWMDCTFTNSLSWALLGDSDPATWCHDSTFLHDPFNPRTSHATKAVPSLVTLLVFRDSSPAT